MAETCSQNHNISTLWCIQMPRNKGMGAMQFQTNRHWSVRGTVWKAIEGAVLLGGNLKQYRNAVSNRKEPM